MTKASLIKENIFLCVCLNFKAYNIDIRAGCMSANRHGNEELTKNYILIWRRRRTGRRKSYLGFSPKRSQIKAVQAHPATSVGHVYE